MRDFEGVIQHICFYINFFLNFVGNPSIFMLWEYHKPITRRSVQLSIIATETT